MTIMSVAPERGSGRALPRSVRRSVVARRGLQPGLHVEGQGHVGLFLTQPQLISEHWRCPGPAHHCIANKSIHTALYDHTASQLAE